MQHSNRRSSSQLSVCCSTCLGVNTEKKLDRGEKQIPSLFSFTFDLIMTTTTIRIDFSLKREVFSVVIGGELYDIKCRIRTDICR